MIVGDSSNSDSSIVYFRNFMAIVLVLVIPNYTVFASVANDISTPSVRFEIVIISMSPRTPVVPIILRIVDILERVPNDLPM